MSNKAKSTKKGKKRGGRVTAKKPKLKPIEFPEDMTQEEMYFFESHSGMGILELATLIGSPVGPKVLPLATLISISLARQGIKLAPKAVIKANKYYLDLDDDDLSVTDVVGGLMGDDDVDFLKAADMTQEDIMQLDDDDAEDAELDIADEEE